MAENIFKLRIQQRVYIQQIALKTQQWEDNPIIHEWMGHWGDIELGMQIKTPRGSIVHLNDWSERWWQHSVQRRLCLHHSHLRWAAGRTPTLNMCGGFLGFNMAIPLNLHGEMKTYGHPQAYMNIYRVVLITNKNSKQLKFSSLCKEITNWSIHTMNTTGQWGTMMLPTKSCPLRLLL